MPDLTPWTAWAPVPGLPPLSNDTLRELLDGGQSFRWHRLEDGCWQGIWSDHVVQLRLNGERVEYRSALGGGSVAPGDSVSDYLGASASLEQALDGLPWRSDPHLRRCMDAFVGLRILRQPFGETLLCFLCSATKQIVQIKQMTALLAQRLGQPIAFGQHRLPTWSEVARASEADLRACLLGFRARYIYQTAQFLAQHPGWLEETERLDYPLAKERLRLLPGVGEKVADCVLLFGAGRLEAFPVDVWILRTMGIRYGLKGWGASQLTQFGRVHFGPAAGLAQQFLFAWERQAAREERRAAHRPEQ